MTLEDHSTCPRLKNRPGLQCLKLDSPIKNKEVRVYKTDFKDINDLDL